MADEVNPAPPQPSPLRAGPAHAIRHPSSPWKRPSRPPRPSPSSSRAPPRRPRSWPASRRSSTRRRRTGPRWRRGRPATRTSSTPCTPRWMRPAVTWRRRRAA
ncbi:hypothetical protein DFJ74DRAFT_774530 [Hyaloraphidium curvatum]|nr:hypothetical protein DFJ74DRAFT_774530 [Hyaloraphidium curvatum]